MSRIAIHKGGSALTVTLRHKYDGRTFEGMVMWPNENSDIFIFSNEAILCGCTPPGSDWLKYGYIYSYLLRHGSISIGVETFDLMSHLPHDLLFVGFGSAVDSSRMGEAALKMDLNSLRKGEALECEIMNSGDVLLRGKLFRSKTGELYVLHNDARGEGSTPKDENWRQVSGYTYSWCLLERDLRNDCKPETYKFIRPATLLYHCDPVGTVDNSRAEMTAALGILKEGVGARVSVKTSGGSTLDGILIKDRDNYYILHDNSKADGGRPSTKWFSRDGLRLPYSWDLDHSLIGSSQIMTHTFKLVHAAPMFMGIEDPMNPIAFSVGGVAKPTVTKDAYSSSYDPHSFEKKETRTEEPELILFKKSTAKVTRCDVQPMQSPQIITKNKK